MNSENSNTSDEHKPRLNLMNKGDLQRGAKSVSLADLSIYYTWKNIKKSYSSNKFKILGTIQDEEFNLPDGFLFCARHSGLF